VCSNDALRPPPSYNHAYIPISTADIPTIHTAAIFLPYVISIPRFTLFRNKSVLLKRNGRVPGLRVLSSPQSMRYAAILDTNPHGRFPTQPHDGYSFPTQSFFQFASGALAIFEFRPLGNNALRHHLAYKSPRPISCPSKRRLFLSGYLTLLRICPLATGAALATPPP